MTADGPAELGRLLRANPVASAVLLRATELDLPDWYLGAGSVAQTVWNHLHAFPPGHGIEDYDLVYFDPRDLTEAGERAAADRFRDLAAPVDVKNEARVHLWCADRFGTPIPPYRSAEDALATWPTTATSVGVRRDRDGTFRVCAPFGLADLFGMVVRPNRALVTRAVYEDKARRWAAVWPRLTIVPW